MKAPEIFCASSELARLIDESRSVLEESQLVLEELRVSQNHLVEYLAAANSRLSKARGVSKTLQVNIDNLIMRGSKR